MFADPFIIDATRPTAGTTAAVMDGTGSTQLSFVCTGRGPLSSTYRYTVSSSHYIDLFIGRQLLKAGRVRSTVRFVETELVTDPVTPAINSRKTTTCFVVADVGVLGTGTNYTKMMHMLATLLYTPTDNAATFDKVLAGET